jgi:hypothetical protein
MRVGITGHRGLSDDVAERIRQGLRAELQALPHEELVGVSCIADGPDAWFAQIVLDLGGRIEVVVPATTYREGLPEWHHAAYDGLVEAAAEVHHAGFEASDSQAHMAGSEILVGLVDQLIAVCPGQGMNSFSSSVGRTTPTGLGRRSSSPRPVVVYRWR